ncbi:MAG: type II toxin-antitoxin system MqsA family antitoxin [Pseudomonadota bacterium]
MKCVICRHGETAPGLVTVTLQREGTVVIMRDVPANVCRNCGEYYLDESVAAKVYSEADAAAARRAEVEILRYAA